MKAIMGCLALVLSSVAHGQLVSSFEVTNKDKLAELQKQIKERELTCDNITRVEYARDGYAGTEGHMVVCQEGRYWVALYWPSPLRPLIHKYAE